MLTRAATRAVRSSALRKTCRPYSTPAKPKAPSYVPAPRAPKPARPSATAGARQTSPGTTIPTNAAFNPNDTITNPDAVTPAAAVPKHPPSHETPAPLPTSSASTESPIKSPVPDLGPEPVTPETPLADTEPEPVTPKGPLPDLRQGIPSTLFDELNKSQAKENAAASEADPETSSSSGGGGRRTGPDDNQDQEFDRSDYETSIDRKRARLTRWAYLAFASFIPIVAAYTTRPYDESENPEGLAPEHITGWAPQSMWARLNARWSSQSSYYTDPTFRKLLPDVPEAQRPPYTLVLSLEDLMIHSNWSREHGWRTAKRPGIDYFLRYLSQYYEIVLFTSVPMAMADTVVKKLDPFRIIQWPLFREATRYESGEYVKDLSFLNRPLDKTIIIDTKAAHVKNQPENAIVLEKWKGDAKDPHAKDLVALIPFLEYLATMGVEDVRKVIESFKDTEIPHEFARRESLAREAFNAQLAAENARKPKKSIGGLLNKALGIKAQPGGMTLGEGETVAEGLAQGKMLSDQIRERGQREYERLNREIEVNGAKWLKEMEEEEKKFMEAQSKEMKSWLPGLGGGK